MRDSAHQVDSIGVVRPSASATASAVSRRISPCNLIIKHYFIIGAAFYIFSKSAKSIYKQPVKLCVVSTELSQNRLTPRKNTRKRRIRITKNNGE